MGFNKVMTYELQSMEHEEGFKETLDCWFCVLGRISPHSTTSVRAFGFRIIYWENLFLYVTITQIVWWALFYLGF